MIIGTAGHIDHGKTSLVRALTGVDTDRLPEEKRRGITIELGFAPLVLEGVGSVGIVDVPGHEAFVRTMVAGASGIDVALLVVAADEGVMPQTREHLAILGLLGTRGGVVALTKCDLVDADWLALVKADVSDVLRETALDGAAIVPTSATTGTGIGAVKDALGAVLAGIPERDIQGVFRMPVDRAFTVRGTGSVVTGTVWEGRVTGGDTVVVQPSGKAARVRGVQVHGGEVASAASGTRTAVAIAGLEVAEVARGSWLCSDAAWPATTLLRADVSLLADANHALRPREWVRLHIGTADVGARVVAPGGAFQPGDRRPARLVLQEPVLARAGDRFVLRLASPPSTIGGGVVVDPLPPRRRAVPWERLVRHDESLGRLLGEAGVEGLAWSGLAARMGVPDVELRSLLARADLAVGIGQRYYDPGTLSGVVSSVEQLVEEEHRRDPLGDGLVVATVPARLRATAELVDRAVVDLIRAGKVERRGALLARAGWVPLIEAANDAFRTLILAELRAAGAEPPDVATLAERHNRDPVPILRLLERDQRVVSVESGRFYAAEEVERLVTRLRAGMTEGREYSPSELRDVLGLSRKYLIPFLEYCDRKRITERRATGRVRVASMA
jgi:selenocysteine-specific elongation factor